MRLIVDRVAEEKVLCIAKRGLSDRSSKGKTEVDYSRLSDVYVERIGLTKEVYCLANVCAHTQLIECLTSYVCTRYPIYKNLLASLLFNYRCTDQLMCIHSLPYYLIHHSANSANLKSEP